MTAESPESLDAFNKHVKFISWLILVVTTCKFFILAVVYAHECNRFDEARYPHADIKDVHDNLFALETLMLTNLLTFFMSFVLLFGVYRTSAVCFLVWMAASTFIVLAEFSLHLIFSSSIRLSLVYFLFLWDLVMLAMILFVFSLYWKHRHHAKFTIQQK